MNAEKQQEEHWDMVVEPKSSLLQLNIKEIWKYRDLLMLLVRRDFVAFYKQTILGPLWFFIQPLMTTVMYYLIFTKVAKLSTDDVPPLLFYLAGVTCWNYFSESLTKTADTFNANASIFGKVYFPRLVIPLSIIVSNLVRLLIQFLLFLALWVYYLSTTRQVHPHWEVMLLLPFLIILMAALALGLGIIFSSLTTKYRDLRFLLTFGIQLLMFATPVVYPLSLASVKYKWLIAANPFTAIIETFRYAFLGKGEFNWLYISYSVAVTIVILLAGTLIFNRVEKNFIDTV